MLTDCSNMGLKVTSFTLLQKWHKGKQLCCVSDTSGLVMNYNPGFGSSGSPQPPTALHAYVGECGSTGASQPPSTWSLRPRSSGSGWLCFGGSWRGRMPPVQTCGCWTCGPPLYEACQRCRLHPKASPCHVEATAYSTEDRDLDS